MSGTNPLAGSSFTAMTIRSVLADRRLHIVAGSVVALLLALLVVLAMMPWGMFKATIEKKLSDRFGRPVTIGAVERRDSFSLSPTIALRDLRIPQAAWAGPGDLVRIDRAEVRFPVIPLLFGHFRPGTIDVNGAHIALVRDAERRESWRKPEDRKPGHGSGSSIQGLRIANSTLTYRDAFQDRAFALKIAADPKTGITLAGTGTIRGEPVTLAANGPAIERGAGKPWPFRATISGPALTVSAAGTMDAPLDTGHMTIDVAARADDLKFVDAVIEAGLFGTQPVRLAAHARHDGDVWKVTGLNGLIGGSDVAGHVDVRKVDGRTKLDGAVVSNALNFDDFASRAGQAAALAKRQAVGPRLVPDTRINIRKITRTDGTITFTVRQLVSAAPSSLQAMRGTIRIDHQLLTVSPFTIELTRGSIAGSVVVDQRGGPAIPTVTFDLKLADSSIGALAGGGDEVNGRVDARIRLKGPGSTIREAVGRSDGTIGLVARNGTLPAKIASLLGFDAVRGILTDEAERAGLRCAVLRLAVRRGIGTVDPFVIDTTRSGTTGQGRIVFPSEAIAMKLTGAPKAKTILRFPGSLIVGGTIKAPDVHLPADAKSAGNFFKALGRSITGTQGPRATDADCAGLAARALR
ncbi:MAG: asmA family protein [Sphingomonas bacterium]|uniref:AsmA family protein n=1 Tax=Sphingomonas bacterium TaxID=1895847 RepID=UPI0026291F2F|nr:AsmA family protein [Sphingomonas bacterium]MDB5704493.1 asmA family protein [Sphingomonas bacterium]